MAQTTTTNTIDDNVVYRFFSWFGNKIKDTFNAAVDTVKGWLGYADEALPPLPEPCPEAPALSEPIPDSLAGHDALPAAVLEPAGTVHDLMM